MILLLLSIICHLSIFSINYISIYTKGEIIEGFFPSLYFLIFVQCIIVGNYPFSIWGEMSEWTKALDCYSIVRFFLYRGFKSLSFRLCQLHGIFFIVEERCEIDKMLRTKNITTL